MIDQIRKDDKCIADVVFRIIGKSVNLGKVVIDTKTYSFEGYLTLDKIKGVVGNQLYIEYTPQSREETPMKLFVDMRVTGDPVKDFSYQTFWWKADKPFEDIQLEFKKVIYSE